MTAARTFDPSQIISFVGIDVSKSWLDCYLRPNKAYIRCGNDLDGFAQLDQWLRDHISKVTTAVICMENTGVYDDQLLLFLTEKNWRCAVEKTTILEKVGPEHHRKDDQFDAARIAEYADRYLDQLTLWQPKEEALEQLRQLYSERCRLVVQQGAVKNKRAQITHHTVTSGIVEQCWNEQLAFYHQQIGRLEKQMHKLVEAHEGLRRYQKLLLSIPGIGHVTAWLWLVQFYGESTLSSKKIASRFGFAPHSKRSGSSIRGKTRSSGHGTAQMRKCMSLAALAASSYYEKFRHYKQRKVEEGKIWPIIRNNLINKLITIICAIWNTGQPYSPDHISRFDRQKTTS